jgi:hypothetical protein
MAAVTELGDERRAVLMDGLAGSLQVRDHLVIPIVHLGPGTDTTGRMNAGASEAADQAAASFGLRDEIAEIFLGRHPVGDESGAQRGGHDSVP